MSNDVRELAEKFSMQRAESIADRQGAAEVLESLKVLVGTLRTELETRKAQLEIANENLAIANKRARGPTSEMIASRLEIELAVAAGKLRVASDQSGIDSVISDCALGQVDDDLSIRFNPQLGGQSANAVEIELID